MMDFPSTRDSVSSRRSMQGPFMDQNRNDGSFGMDATRVSLLSDNMTGISRPSQMSELCRDSVTSNDSRFASFEQHDLNRFNSVDSMLNGEEHTQQSPRSYSIRKYPSLPIAFDESLLEKGTTPNLSARSILHTPSGSPMTLPQNPIIRNSYTGNNSNLGKQQQQSSMRVRSESQSNVRQSTNHNSTYNNTNINKMSLESIPDTKQEMDFYYNMNNSSNNSSHPRFSQSSNQSTSIQSASNNVQHMPLPDIPLHNVINTYNQNNSLFQESMDMSMLANSSFRLSNGFAHPIPCPPSSALVLSPNTHRRQLSTGSNTGNSHQTYTQKHSQSSEISLQASPPLEIEGFLREDRDDTTNMLNSTISSISNQMCFSPLHSPMNSNTFEMSISGSTSVTPQHQPRKPKQNKVTGASTVTPCNVADTTEIFSILESDEVIVVIDQLCGQPDTSKEHLETPPDIQTYLQRSYDEQNGSWLNLYNSIEKGYHKNTERVQVQLTDCMFKPEDSTGHILNQVRLSGLQVYNEKKAKLHALYITQLKQAVNINNQRNPKHRNTTVHPKDQELHIIRYFNSQNDNNHNNNHLTQNIHSSAANLHHVSTKSHKTHNNSLLTTVKKVFHPGLSILFCDPRVFEHAEMPDTESERSLSLPEETLVSKTPLSPDEDENDFYSMYIAK